MVGTIVLNLKDIIWYMCYECIYFFNNIMLKILHITVANKFDNKIGIILNDQKLNTQLETSKSKRKDKQQHFNYKN